MPGAPSRQLLADLEQRTFRFFWETTDPHTGLARDRFPTPSPCSIAAVGFGLTAMAIGAERGYLPRAQITDPGCFARSVRRVLAEGSEPTGKGAYRGFYYHFVDMNSGHRMKQDVELSTVDTALFIAGALHCQSCFRGTSPVEVEIRALADLLYQRIEWPWMQWRTPSIVHGWLPEPGFIGSDWKGYNEAMILYILALGSPTFPVEPDAWEAWTSSYDTCWGTHFGQQHLNFPPMFGHQFSHIWIDFRRIRDDFMRDHGLDYFENSRRAVLMQRQYAIENPMKWAGYGPDVWGISACDGPADVTRTYAGAVRRFRTYAGRGAGGPHTWDDGTLTPMAVVASLPFAPDPCTRATVEIHRRWGEHLYDTYGFKDAFNPSFDFDVAPQMGRIVPEAGWFGTDYLGIDQGPMIAMLANHQGELVWRAMKRNPHVVRGLKRAGFRGGWLDA